MKLSVTIITLNEADNIRQCLQSVSFADEIIVLDSGSKDNTVAICREYTDLVFETDWPGYGVQRNRAISHATGDWVLSIDADEQVTPELQQEIKNVIQQSAFAAYKIPFRSCFLGKLIRFGDWKNEKHIRLFNKSRAKFNDNEVHEDLIVDGEIGQLKNYILHEPYANYDELVAKINRYSSAGALVRFKQGKKATFKTALFKGGWAFLRSYIFRLGFLDGKAGFMVATSVAEYTYYRYLKLALLLKQQA